MKSKIFLFLIFSLVFLGLSCRNSQKTALKKLYQSSQKMQAHIGFVLYDALSQKTLVNYQGDKYFVPASNTKLYTFYLAQLELKDSLPTINYTEQGDSLLFWGCGDPSFLNASFSNKTYEFLKHSNKQLFLLDDSKETPNFWPKGWQWDDYNQYYQPEITTLPIYENSVVFRVSETLSVTVLPSYFEKYVEIKDLDIKNQEPIVRDYDKNRFVIYKKSLKQGYKKQIPFKTSPALVADLLSDTLKRKVSVLQMPMPKDYQQLYGSSKMPLCKQMLVESDNLIAEQFGIMLGTNIWQKKPLNSMLKEVKCSDFSGMSRMNLSTPRNIVLLLDSIQRKIGSIDSTIKYFPIGSKTGTLKNMYLNMPWIIYAKTGSMQGIYNQSGYIKTRQNKWLIFSYMSNNFPSSISSTRKEAEEFITWIYENY